MKKNVHVEEIQLPTETRKDKNYKSFRTVLKIDNNIMIN